MKTVSNEQQQNSEEVAAIACQWTTILEIEVTGKQVLKCLAAAQITMDDPTALKVTAQIWEKENERIQ